MILGAGSKLKLTAAYGAVLWALPFHSSWSGPCRPFFLGLLAELGATRYGIVACRHAGGATRFAVSATALATAVPGPVSASTVLAADRGVLAAGWGLGAARSPRAMDWGDTARSTGIVGSAHIGRRLGSWSRNIVRGTAERLRRQHTAGRPGQRPTAH